MVRTAALIGASLALAACQSAFEQAEDRYNFMKANRASKAELCAAAREVVDAAAGDRESYQFQIWSVRANLDCAEARRT